MTVRELIKALTDEPMDAVVYIGKGIGPLGTVASEVHERVYVILSPESRHG